MALRDTLVVVAEGSGPCEAQAPGLVRRQGESSAPSARSSLRTARGSQSRAVSRRGDAYGTSASRDTRVASSSPLAAQSRRVCGPPESAARTPARRADNARRPRRLPAGLSVAACGGRGSACVSAAVARRVVEAFETLTMQTRPLASRSSASAMASTSPCGRRRASPFVASSRGPGSPSLAPAAHRRTSPRSALACCTVWRIRRARFGWRARRACRRSRRSTFTATIGPS